MTSAPKARPLRSSPVVCGARLGARGRPAEPTPSHSRALERAPCFGLPTNAGGSSSQSEHKTAHDPAGSGRWRSSVLAKVNATCARATNRSRARYTGSSALGLTHDSGAATSTAPARHTRHARRVTPQRGHGTRTTTHRASARWCTETRCVALVAAPAYGATARIHRTHDLGRNRPLAPRARAARLHRRQVGLREEHDAVQPRHARHRQPAKGSPSSTRTATWPRR